MRRLSALLKAKGLTTTTHKAWTGSPLCMLVWPWCCVEEILLKICSSMPLDFDNGYTVYLWMKIFYIPGENVHAYFIQNIDNGCPVWLWLMLTTNDMTRGRIISASQWLFHCGATILTSVHALLVGYVEVQSSSEVRHTTFPTILYGSLAPSLQNSILINTQKKRTSWM